MIEIKGQYGTAKVFTDTLEPSAEGLIRTFCDQPYSADSKIRIMPDVHIIPALGFVLYCLL